jgi:hypothetical protein
MRSARHCARSGPPLQAGRILQVSDHRRRLVRHRHRAGIVKCRDHLAVHLDGRIGILRGIIGTSVAAAELAACIRQPPSRHQVAKLGVVPDRDDLSIPTWSSALTAETGIPCFAFRCCRAGICIGIGNASAVVNVLDVVRWRGTQIAPAIGDTRHVGPPLSEQSQAASNHHANAEMIDKLVSSLSTGVPSRKTLPTAAGLSIAEPRYRIGRPTTSGLLLRSRIDRTFLHICVNVDILYISTIGARWLYAPEHQE